jgi:hypothetical protein
MKKKHISHKSRTDWNRVDKLRDKDIDLSENPEVTPEMFAKAVLRKGYQTRINSLLKAYKEANQNESGRTI